MDQPESILEDTKAALNLSNTIFIDCWAYLCGKATLF